MAEEENKRNSCISFYNNPKRKHSNNKQLFDNDNLNDNSSTGANKSDGVTKLNEKNVVCDKSAALLDVVIDTIDDNDDKLTSDERRKRSTASAGVGCGGTGSRMTSPRPQRVHFSDEDSDGLSRSSRHSSCVDLRQEKSSSPFSPSNVGSSSVQGQGPVMRPKDLKLAGISQNPTGVKSLVGGGSCYHHIQNQAPLNRSSIPIVKPQHHRFSYMHCDTHYTCSPTGVGAGHHQHNTSREHHPATVLYSDCAQLSSPTEESSQSQSSTKLRYNHTIKP